MLRVSTIISLLSSLLCALPASAPAAQAWPAEPRAAASDIGAALNGGEPSGAAWHEGRSRLFIVDDIGRLVHMNADGTDPLVLDGLPPDIEAAFELPGANAHIFVGLEDPPTLLRVVIDTGETDGQWPLPEMLVGAADKRLEGLAFLPDAHAGAIHSNGGQLYNGGAGSALGSGGLVLAGHQGNGRIYIYDVDLASPGPATFVNFYGPFSDGAATLLDLSDLDFHTATGMVYALWDNPIVGEEQGRLGLLDPAQELAVVTVWNTATDSLGEEGFALIDSGSGDGIARAVIAEDEPAKHAVYLYSLFVVAGAQTTTTSTSTTTTTMGSASCGDPSADLLVTATDALMVLRAAVGSFDCAQCLCDVDGSGAVTAVDALRTLHIAVGQPLELLCPLCAA